MKYSILNYKLVNRNNNFRLDADFYHPDYLIYFKQIKKHEVYYLTKILHPTEIKRVYSKKGIQILLAQNVRNNELNFSNIVFMDESKKNDLKRNKLHYDDVVLTRSGANFGQSSSFKLNKNIYACADVLIIKNTNEIKGGYLSTFLNSKQGKALLNRGSYGMAQPHIAPSYLYKLPIARFNIFFEEKIDQLINKSETVKMNALNCYFQARKILLAELGLQDWKPKPKLTFVKNYSDTKESERVDAEYFQPKYDEIIEAIENYQGGFDTINNLVKLRDLNFKPIEKEEYKYIELSNIGNSGEVIRCTEAIGLALPTRARRLVKHKDLIVSSIEGSLNKIALIPKEFDSSLCSTGLYVLYSNKINTETLLVFLKSMAGFLQLKKGCSGTILSAISKDELHRVVIPKFNYCLQDQIKQKLTVSSELRKKSKVLLEIAKKGVEMAIEKDEETAEKWINAEVNKLGVKTNA